MKRNFNQHSLSVYILRSNGDVTTHCHRRPCRGDRQQGFNFPSFSKQNANSCTCIRRKSAREFTPGKVYLSSLVNSNRARWTCLEEERCLCAIPTHSSSRAWFSPRSGRDQQSGFISDSVLAKPSTGLDCSELCTESLINRSDTSCLGPLLLNCLTSFGLTRPLFWGKEVNLFGAKFHADGWDLLHLERSVRCV